MPNVRISQSTTQSLITLASNERVVQSTIQLLAIPSLSASCNNPPSGTSGQAYSQTFSVSGGDSPYVWSLLSGQFPTGLTLNSATGVLSGTPTTPGTYVFTVQVTDNSAPPLTTQFTCSIVINSIPQPPQIATLRFEIPKKRWFPHLYNDAVELHYLDETYAGSVDNEQLLLLGRNTGFIYRSGGDTDNGVTLTSTVTTPSMDGGDDRVQKLFVDIMTDADNAGVLNANAQFNNQTVGGPTVSYTYTGPRAQQLQNISSLGNLGLYRNVSITYTWTGGPDGPRIYVCEPSGYAQPYVSTFWVTQYNNLAFPGYKHHRRLYAGYISNTTLLFTISTQDGRTYGPYTLPSTGGQFKIIPLMLDQGIKDLAFAYQIDGGGNNFVLFPEAWTVEVKEWTEPSYIPLAIFKT